jgi:hypothetical protein
MNMKTIIMTIAMAATLTLSLPGAEVEQLKADLIGHTMGGREKSWRFQSPEQIKDLAVESTAEDSQKRIYIMALQLQDSPATGRYAARARVEYEKTSTGWRVKQVGLLSLTKVK